MKPARMNDNRHLNDVESYLQARVDALKRHVTDLETQLEHERATSKMLRADLSRVATQNSKLNSDFSAEKLTVSIPACDPGIQYNTQEKSKGGIRLEARGHRQYRR